MSGDAVVRVASFNVRNGRAFDGADSWPFRSRATALALAGLGADVVGLQEVYAFQLRSLLRRVPSLDAVGVARGHGGRGERCPVLHDRARTTLLDHRTRWFGPTPDEPGTTLPGARFPRIATTCRLLVEPQGRAVTVVSTHLDATSAANRMASAEQLLDWVDASEPTIVVGDLNARPGDPVLARLADGGLRQALPSAAGGTEHAFTGRTDGGRIDHILVSDHLEVVGAAVTHPRPHGRLPSDHWPVVADLRMADR